jgi:hypothetical protein
MNEAIVARKEPEELKVVGKSGQISLGKRYAGKVFRVQRRDRDTIVLTSVALVPESQMWTLREPHRSRIERGLAWIAEHPPAESDLESLLKAHPLRRARKRVRG